MNDEWLAGAEELLGYRFVDRRILEEALTHRSWVHEKAGPTDHNERLEFLGDAILGFVAARQLFRDYPDAPEGELTRRRAAYVSEHGISGCAGPQSLGRLVRMGKGQARAAGHSLPSIMSDSTEAVIAAVFLDGGLEEAENAIKRLLGAVPDLVEPVVNPKSRLQERLQRLVGEAPSYEAERVGGPDHAPRYEVRVSIGDEELGHAEGASKKEASLSAAAVALESVDDLDDKAMLLIIGQRAAAGEADAADPATAVVLDDGAPK